jgi:hypothetical protein
VATRSADHPGVDADVNVYRRLQVTEEARVRIGELAARVGTSTRTLRYYEARGLLPARRSVNGYRDYDEDDLRLVREIRALRTYCGRTGPYWSSSPRSGARRAGRWWARVRDRGSGRTLPTCF